MSNVKLELDLSNIFSSYDEDERYSISDMLKEKIVQELYNKVTYKFDCEINSFMDKTNKEYIKDLLDKSYKKYIDENWISLKMKKDQRSSELITIEEYFTNQINKDNSSYIIKHITDLSKKLWDEMKQRYDLQFASMIVNNLNKQWLLKEWVINSLITN